MAVSVELIAVCLLLPCSCGQERSSLFLRESLLFVCPLLHHLNCVLSLLIYMHWLRMNFRLDTGKGPSNSCSTELNCRMYKHDLGAILQEAD